MNRAEGTGLVVAVLAHAGILAVLSAMFLHPELPPRKQADAIEVSLSDEVGLESQAPVVSSEAEAAKLSPVEAPVELEPEPPAPAPEPVPEPKPAPNPKPEPKPAETAPAPVTKPQQPTKSTNKSTRPPTTRAVQPTGNLDGLELGKTNNKTDSRSTTPPAEKAGPAVVASLASEVLRQIKPFWKPPTGADSEKLRTTVIVQLDQNGAISGEPRVTQTGITPSNSAQAALHKERAVRAVRLAAPFKLPAKFYDAWKKIGPTLYEGL